MSTTAVMLVTLGCVMTDWVVETVLAVFRALLF